MKSEKAKISGAKRDHQCTQRNTVPLGPAQRRFSRKVFVFCALSSCLVREAALIRAHICHSLLADVLEVGAKEVR